MIYICKHGHTEEPYISKKGYRNCRACRRISVRKYEINYPDRVLNTHYFGGNRDKCLERDNYCCVECGMTSEEHFNRWSRQLTIDHRDGNGRSKLVADKNNSLDNLQTLCLQCHGRKDVVRRKKFSNKYIKLREAS